MSLHQTIIFSLKVGGYNYGADRKRIAIVQPSILFSAPRPYLTESE
jgi:hypothetical protein